MKIDQVLEWIGKSPINQLIAGGAALVLLLLVFLLFRRRGRKPEVGAQAAAARIRATRNDLRDVFEGYRDTQPAFHRVMSQIQANRRLDELMSNNEFAGAIAKLRLWQAVRVSGVKPGKQAVGSPLSIQPGSKNPSPEVRAAMITVLRVIYASPQFTRGLSSGTEAELDKLLESLTG